MQLQDAQPLMHDDQRLLEELVALDPENMMGKRIQQQVSADPERKLTVHERTVILVLRDQASIKKAAEIVAREDIRSFLCPGLLRGSDDVFELSKIVTPVILGLVAAGTITIPLIPVLVAAIALQISRMSIASICANYDKQSKEKD